MTKSLYNLSKLTFLLRELFDFSHVGVLNVKGGGSDIALLKKRKFQFCIPQFLLSTPYFINQYISKTFQDQVSIQQYSTAERQLSKKDKKIIVSSRALTEKMQAGAPRGFIVTKLFLCPWF